MADMFGKKNLLTMSHIKYLRPFFFFVFLGLFSIGICTSIYSYGIEIAKYVLDDREINGDKISVEKTLLWRVSADEDKRYLYLLDKDQSKILYSVQANVDDYEYRILDINSPEKYEKVSLKFDDISKLNYIQLFSNYIIYCIEEPLELNIPNTDNYIRYSIYTYDLENNHSELLMNGTSAHYLATPRISKEDKKIIFSGESIDIEKREQNLFIRAYDDNFKKISNFEQNKKIQGGDFRNRERWFSRTVSIVNGSFSNVSLEFEDGHPVFRKYKYNLNSRETEIENLPKEFEVYDYHELNGRYELYELIQNRNYNDLKLLIKDKEKGENYILKNLDGIWINSLTELEDGRFIIQYQNLLQIEHWGVLELDEKNVDNSYIKLLFNDEEGFEFQERFRNPIFEVNSDTVLVYGSVRDAETNTDQLEAYSIALPKKGE